MTPTPVPPIAASKAPAHPGNQQTGGTLAYDHNGTDSYGWMYGFQGGRRDFVTGLYRFGSAITTRCSSGGCSRSPAGSG
jgi:hypothetical protein